MLVLCRQEEVEVVELHHLVVEVLPVGEEVDQVVEGAQLLLELVELYQVLQ
jgi:hypothetical protein